MRENSQLEYKAEVTNTFLKTVSAFANFGEGEIRFGVREDGTLCPIVEPNQVCLDIENKINDNIKPKPDFSLRIDGEEGTIVLRVFEGRYKPYLYKGKAYRRSDTATIEVDQIELKRLVLEGSNLYFEELACECTNLEFTNLQSKLRQQLNVNELTTDVLRTLGFFNERMEYNNAAAIFADKNNFPGIDIVRFGHTINEILDRETVVNESILKQYDTAIRLYRTYYQYEEIKGIDRNTVELIPEKAFREALANALVHRSWDRNINIRIAMHPKKVEITSPGGLPKMLSKEEYLNGCISSLQNPVIGNLFFRLNYIEMFGTGIRRIKECYERQDTKPSFSIMPNSITVSLPVLNQNMELTTDEEIIIKAFDSGMSLASSEIVEKTGFGKNKVLNLLKGLVEKNYVQVIGSGRGTKYKR